jgi:CubicO group peptidase (beta-lactamase class C family)
MQAQRIMKQWQRWLRGAAAAAILVSALLPAARPAQASAGLPLGQFDPDSVGWYSYRNLSESTFDSDFAEKSEAGYILIDIDIDVVDGERSIGAVWQENLDGRAWIAHYKKTHDEYSAKWTEYKNAGYRVIEQETYVLDGVRYWAGIWVAKDSGQDWASRRNMTSAQLDDYVDDYWEVGLRPIDVDAYPYGSGVRYSAAFVENTDGIGVIMRHDMTEAQWEQNFDDFADDGYRVMDLDVYVLDGEKTFAAIWYKNTNGRGWYSYRDMTYDGFTNRRYQLWDAGYRLVDYDVYYLPGGERRYSGVWRQNNDRPDWPLKDEITNDIVQPEVDNFEVPGMSVAIAHKGELVYLRGFGDADRENDVWAHSRTVFRLASISKAIAGILTLQVENQVAAFDITDATRTWAPELPVHHTHTIGQLASMRAGVGHYSDHGSANEPFDTALEGCEFFEDDPLVYTPGMGYKYSTHSYCFLAAALEAATGDTVDDLVWERLSAPFGLTSLQVENRDDGNENRSQVYEDDGDLGTADDTSWKELGGGLEGSAYDLARLGIKLVDEQILNEDDLNTLWTAVDGFSAYGLGWVEDSEDGTPVVWKNGNQLGSNTYIRIYPEKEFVIVVLANRDGGGHSAVDVGNAIGSLMLDNEALLNPITVNPILPVFPVAPEVEDPIVPVRLLPIRLVELPVPDDEGVEPAPPVGEDETPPAMPEDEQQIAPPPSTLYLPMTMP